MTENTVTVPEGHKVVVIRPSQHELMVTLESGMLLLDFGVCGKWNDLSLKVEEGIERGNLPPLVVILQTEMVEHLTSSGELEDFYDFWKDARGRGAHAVWVLPLTASSNPHTINSIRKTGFAVHASAEDGACFVEVHRPDGSIVIGMAGPAL